MDKGEIMYLWANDYGSPIDQGFKANIKPFSASDNYAIHLSNYQQLYGSTTAGLWSYHNNKPFTTKDADHDSYPYGNCGAIYSETPFWYNWCWSGSINGGGENQGDGYYNGAYWVESARQWGTDNGYGAGNGWIFVR